MGIKINDVVVVVEDTDNLYLEEVGIVRCIHSDGMTVEFGPRDGQALNERYYWRGFYDEWGEMPIRKISEPLNFEVGDRVVVSSTHEELFVNEGEVGTVINIMHYGDGDFTLGVEFDNDVNGHSCSLSIPHQGKFGHCLMFHPSSLLITEKVRRPGEFQVGDRVAISEDYNEEYYDYIGFFRVGDTGTVTQIDNRRVDVEFDCRPSAMHGTKWSFIRTESGIFPLRKIANFIEQFVEEFY